MKNQTDKRRNTALDVNAIQEKGATNVSSISKAPSVHFAMVARAVTRAGNGIGLEVPGFRSPPRSGSLDRTLRRHSSGSIVAVRVKGRPFAAVIADFVEGVIVCNRLTGREAGDARNVLWHAAIQAGRKSDSEHTHRPTVLVHDSAFEDTTAAA